MENSLDWFKTLDYNISENFLNIFWAIIRRFECWKPQEQDEVRQDIIKLSTQAPEWRNYTGFHVNKKPEF